MKDYLVEFSSAGGRIIKDQNEIKLKKDLPNVLLNPKIPRLVPPHLWFKAEDRIGIKNSKDAILEMTPESAKPFIKSNDKLLTELIDEKISALDIDAKFDNLKDLILHAERLAQSSVAVQAYTKENFEKELASIKKKAFVSVSFLGVCILYLLIKGLI